MVEYAAAPGVNPSKSPWPLLMLVARLVLFFAWQAVIAGVLALTGEPEPFRASAGYWPLSVTLGNLVTLGLLRWLTRREGLSWSQFLGADFRREFVRKDLLALLGVLVVAGPIAMLPNFGLALALYGDMLAPMTQFVQPMHAGLALVCIVLFPVTQGLAELPTYFAYAMPRLSARWSSSLWAMLVAAFWLGAQHMTVPFIADWRFVVWRLGMFIPFALLLGVTIRWRPRLLPYLMVVHVLIDIQPAVSVWLASVSG